MEERAEFYRIIEADARNLLTDFVAAGTNAEVASVREMLKVLRAHMARQMPRGAGMEAVTDLTNDLSAAGTTRPTAGAPAVS